jgi:hypothetical protein
MMDEASPPATDRNEVRDAGAGKSPAPARRRRAQVSS